MLFDPFLQESKPIIQQAPEFARENNMHSRHPMFRMPEWMSEDDDVSHLASRMSHGPNWAFGNRGPWREMQNPGDNETPNRGESVAHNIPIRIEAEAPPGYVPQQNEPKDTNDVKTSEVDPTPSQNRINPEMMIGNQPAYASKTATALDSGLQEDIPRDARSSSAPPDVKDKEMESPRFISKISITPQQPQPQEPQQQQHNANHTFNNIAKPFPTDPGIKSTNAYVEMKPTDIVDSSKVIPSPNSSNNTGDMNKMSQGQHIPQSQNSAGPKSSIIRNIPIQFEGQDDNKNINNAKPSPPRQHNQPREPNWNQPFETMPNRFHEEMFQDPFFGMNRFDSPATQQRGQPIANNFSQRKHPYPEPQREQAQNLHQQHNVSKPTVPAAHQEEFKEPRQPPREKLRKEPDVEKTCTKEIPQNPQPKDVQMEKIEKVRNSLTEYQKNVDQLVITQKNKEYRYLDEMLTRSLLELDNIEINGRDDLRQCRRVLIKDINSTIAALEQKVTPVSNVTCEQTDKNQSKESEVTEQDAKKTKIDVDGNEDQTINENNKHQCNIKEQPVIIEAKDGEQ